MTTEAGITITFFFKETKKGFTAKCDFIEMSIHKGLKAWGKSREAAINNLSAKWNKQVTEDYNRLLKNKPANLSVSKYNLIFRL